MKIASAALALLLVVGCDGTPGTDAGTMMGTDAGTMMGTDAGTMMGTDAGTMMGIDAGPPDMMAATRQRAATDRIDVVVCGCDMGMLETRELCENFNEIDEADDCEDAAFSANFAGVGGYFTCAANVYETLATCYEGASCAQAALDACEMAADSALMGCDAFIEEAAATAFSTALETCIDTNVVGGAGACPDDTGAISTTGAAVFMGSTVGAGTDLDAPMGCITVTGGGGSPDRAFRWTAPSAGTFVFDTLGSSFDTVLYLRAGCDAAAMALGCNDDLAEMDLRSRVMATLTMGQEVLVVVEGFSSGDAGDFVINVNAAP